ncbi:DUF2510 domain-containing protein [Nocardia rhamnosiphila]|uniref:DUF2510 domain-containing protein n=1 Tax=Nocardia rhamnosiphila TaxID=426716 RepID=A0ABV2WXP5_9NOCA
MAPPSGLVIRALIRVGDKRLEPLALPRTPQPPPAGWYPDDNGQLRWFDGQAWTAFRKPPDQP